MSKGSLLPTRGFTLIELLIVVAIIAILALISVPNFLEAQTRSKVARVKADQRSMATAIEMYSVDENSYPLRNARLGPNGFWQRQLTTPLAYMSSVCDGTHCRGLTRDYAAAASQALTLMVDRYNDMPARIVSEYLFAIAEEHAAMREADPVCRCDSGEAILNACDHCEQLIESLPREEREEKYATLRSKLLPLQRLRAADLASSHAVEKSGNGAGK